MAALDFTLVPLHSSSQFPEETPLHPEIFCDCGLRSIPRPEGATASTRYTCPPCCDLLLKYRDRETTDALSAIGAQIDRAYWQETSSLGTEVVFRESRASRANFSARR